MNFLERIRDWYNGKFIPYGNDSNDAVVLIGGTYERHWTAVVARVVAKFWSDHWQWTIGTVLAICGTLIALLRH